MASSSKLDAFDTLPDPIILLIFSKISHAKYLSQCLVVSKRFSSLVPLTDTVFSPTLPLKPLNTKSLFMILLHKFKSPKKLKNSSYYSPLHLLKNFNHVKSLHIEVPSLDSKMASSSSSSSSSLLKWKAEFGREFKKCVVLVANGFYHNDDKDEIFNQIGEEGNQNFCDDELKMRIIDTISCLIDVSARHFLLNRIIKEHKAVEHARVSDVCKQGILSVGKDEIEEMRKKAISEAESEEKVRSRVPDLKMKMWYVPVMKINSTGYLMKGATVVVIRPVAGKGDEDGGDCRGGGEVFGFDGDEDEKMALDEAVKEILKRTSNYVMTVNSF